MSVFREKRFLPAVGQLRCVYLLRMNIAQPAHPPGRQYRSLKEGSSLLQQLTAQSAITWKKSIHIFKCEM